MDHLQKQREAKIADLKKATKFDSTQELLQKYGGAPPGKTPSKPSQQGPKKDPQLQRQPQQQPQRTGLPPPPTANIPGRHLPPNPPRPDEARRPITPVHGNSPLAAPILAQSAAQIVPDSPGFAPNAFPQVPPPSTAYEHAPHWYDRILDVMLGEDETAAKSRLVLLCSNCRLVNGQAPPGIKTLEDLGRWRCAGCGSWNGTESEGAKVVKEITQSFQADHNGEGWEKVPKAEDLHEESSDAEMADSGIHGSSGHQGPDDAGLSKRVTRSASKKVSNESLH